MTSRYGGGRARRSLRDIRSANDAALRFVFASRDMDPPAELLNSIAPREPKQPRPARAAPNPTNTEAPVLAAVGDLLAAHPKVRLAVRQNSGAMQYQHSSGRMVPVWFYRVIRKPDPMTITDYWGVLTDGRIFAFECKRPSWKHPSSDREIKQWAFINMIVRHGGVGSFVRSVDEVLALLP
jgi:hypothetical protein